MLLDTDEYAVPADGRLTLQLKEDVEEALESNISAEINFVKVTKVSVKNDVEDRDSDYAGEG